MTNQQFITRQTVKFYWKAIKQTTRLGTPLPREDGVTRSDLFWDYEQTPRVM